MARNLVFFLPCALGFLGLFTARFMGDGTAGYYAATLFTAAVYASAWWVWGRRDMLTCRRVGRDIAVGVGLGVTLGAVFVLGATVVSHIPFLADPVTQLLTASQRGGLPMTILVLVMNGIGEELVYRDVVPGQLEKTGLVRGKVALGVASVGIYTLVTVAMGVPLLLLGAASLGALCYLLASNTSRLWAPLAAHLSWSISMLFLLPLFFH
ncbi:CPBP family glutamic-type intramembrane protease [Corynebacterium mayonis]|uniref:CPBP family glutamic-type intramembrane protease n=1 Tax=Corynebacterium mayonis TaxID=3062461 RepID=UPI0031400288